MNDSNIIKSIVQNDPWDSLKKYTPARIALGRTGATEPLQASLNFRLAHAHARDAVHSNLQTEDLIRDLQQFQIPIYALHTKATDRTMYLQRPDLGRKLEEASHEQLSEGDLQSSDMVVILADGLSATAINEHALPLLQLLIPSLRAAGIVTGSIVIVNQGRVAIGDEIGELLKAKLSLVLIGERPGLTAPHSMGAYLTYAPKKGLTDESRNCISNIHSEGLSYNVAANTIMSVIETILRLQLSGIQLKHSTQLFFEPAIGNEPGIDKNSV